MSTTPPDIAALTQKFDAEKQKRLKPEGTAQYVELEESERWKQLSEDPWVDHAALNQAASQLKDGDEVKFLILGAGYGGLLYAVRLIEAGFSTDDIRLIDTAGGVGGTWYWNRYPGLMCDVESYIYMPLLEETGYMPKHKYSYGEELREQAERIAAKWNLKAAFRTAARSSTWDEGKREWVTQLKQDRGPEGVVEMTVRSQFMINANGVLNHPKVPRGLENYSGSVLHTARWDYGVTGGSPTDWSMTGLQGKRVGIIGTGATAIQVTPQLAKWAGELYVFQRTPCSVGVRGQRATDPEEWKKIAGKPGWQRDRCWNFNSFVSCNGEGENLVGDSWTRANAYRAIIGGPHDKPLAPEDIPEHIGNMVAIDYEYSEGVRQRIDDIVKDKNTAEGLKPWYPVWCKRPTFHDDYLPAFNQPNVHLVDTNGKGVSSSTANGLIIGDKKYPLDVLILSTGYRSPGHDGAEPSSHANMTFTGKGGLKLADKWNSEGPATLHGILTESFPNLFLTGPAQTGAAANFAQTQDVLAQQVAYIAANAVKRGGAGAVVEATREGEGAWTARIMKWSMWMGPLAICTPSYINNEGSTPQDPVEQAKMMRGAAYAQGMNAYVQLLQEWREEGSMDGVAVY